MMGELPVFNNHDSRIKFHKLLLEGSIENIRKYELPEGYHFEFYTDGDRDAWIDIEKSAKELSDDEQGMAAWKKYYLEHEQELFNRMIFVVTDSGEKVATATAYYDVTGNDKSGDGWLHWVAVKSEYQGKGLSKPLISYAFAVLKELGYTRAKISTQTTTWLACKIYLDFRFMPVQENAVSSLDGWRIIKRLTNHPSLSQFDSAADGEVLAENI